MASAPHNDETALDELRCRLYLISPPKLDDLDGFAAVFESALQGGDVACFQLRLKNADDADVLAAAERLMPLAHAHDVAFLINDRPDLAKKACADGVHIGQEDMPYITARAVMGEDAIVGVTCHASRHLAMSAGEAGADYVAFGAFFDTSTKVAKAHATVDTLKWWAELMEVPAVAIGGITPGNCRPLVEAGADFLAVANGVWSYSDGAAEAVRRFNAIFDEIAPLRANQD